MSYLRHKQQGLSLVELMVALTLGMVLMAGFLQIFMSVRSTYAANEASSRLQENGRFALDFLTRHARLAGYIDPKRNLEELTGLPRPIMPTASPECPPPGVSADFCSVDRGVIADPVEEQETGDRIVFEYQPPLENGKRYDCAGNEVTKNNLNIITVFTTRRKNDESSLACRNVYIDGSNTSLGGNGYQELVDGIDAIQFQYGLAPNGFVQQYVTASAVDNWNDVAALRIAVLANSINSVTPAPAQKNYYLLDAGPYTFSDGKMRQVFTTTVYLRNSLQ